jgi:TIR domain
VCHPHAVPAEVGQVVECHAHSIQHVAVGALPLTERRMMGDASFLLGLSLMTNQPGNQDPPRAFASYSWDSKEHKEWVKDLATRLRSDGVDVTLDQWKVVPGEQLPKFMETAIRENSYVLIICTPNYKKKSDERKGGVGYLGSPWLVWCVVPMLTTGFPPRQCLSLGVRELCYSARSQSYVARTLSWAVGHSRKEAQRSSELVASRHDAGPFV